MKGGHQKRVEKVRRFASRNKVFSVLIVILVGFLLFRTVSNRTEKKPPNNQAAQTASVESEKLEWRFYPIDLVVLGIGGGFCTIMIIRERRKAKEGLH
jgi:ABC-type uncharacterized transport system permease subunit